MSKVSAKQMAGWTELTSKNYAEQAVWFLNGFWKDLNEAEAENVWNFANKFGELDPDKRAGGSELDEFWSHKFLESLGETLTVIALRERLRTIDVDNNRRMSLTEYLIFRYGKSVADVLAASQGDNQKEIDEAQAMVESAQSAVDELSRRLEEQKASAARASEAADVAKAADAEAKAAADAADAVAAPYRAAVAENDAALKELQAQESAYATKKNELEAIKGDASIGVVKRNRAANELDQLLAEDPLPLRRAKIGQAATLRKMEKAAAPFNEASAKANAAAEKAREERAAAEAAADEANEAARQVEIATADAEKQLGDALAFLEEAKKKSGSAQGAIWWMERTLTEKRKYMPQSKRK